MHDHPAVLARLARLAPDQRTAATAPAGPVLCIAPAGSGKTTTLVARVAWRVANGADPAGILLLAFNRRAVEELAVRVDEALQPLGVEPGTVRVRTFHGLGREILRAAGRPVAPLLERAAVLARLHPGIPRTDLAALDLAFSRLKLDLGVSAAEIAARDPAPGPVARAFLRYEAALAEAGGLDHDDLVAGALAALRADSELLRAWRARAGVLLVDEAQDLDRTQLDLTLTLTAPAHDVTFVGDDDQSIYGWRLADVRRILGLAAALPGLRRVDLEVNYRCPRPVVERAARLVARNRERFRKRIRAGPDAAGRLLLAPDPRDDHVRVAGAIARLPRDGTGRAILARTNRDLQPAAAAALALGIPFRAPGLVLPVEDPRLDWLLDRIAGTARPGRQGGGGAGRRALLRALGAARDRLAAAEARTPPGPRGEDDARDPRRPSALAGMLLGWAASVDDAAELRARVDCERARLAELRAGPDPVALATAHGTKGLEWDHVVVLADGFPARRALADAPDRLRALEEERRLAYVAWTRARRSLTLVYDPADPSPFLLEAFDAAELAPLVARAPGGDASVSSSDGAAGAARGAR